MEKNTRVINLVIYTNEPVPIGMAATNRILSYSSGLVKIGNNVKIFSSKPGFNSIYHSTKGKFEDVKYELLSNVKNWEFNILYKLYLFLQAHIKFIKILFHEKKNNKSIIVLLVSNKIFSIIVIRIITWIFGCPLLQEKSEYPFQFMSKYWIRKVVFANIYSSFIYKLFDGMIVMTEPLYIFFKSKVRQTVPIIKLPLTIDSNRFVNAKVSEEYKFRFIGYCGYMGGNKDGLFDLIEAFSLIIKLVSNIKLVLAGYAEKSELDKLKKIVETKNLLNSVIFTGKLDRDQFPSFLKAAEILVLTRPDNIQAKGGFPTKLGEYLASGRPVIVTKVGDIEKYLIDKEHALLCIPSDIEDIKSKIVSVLLDPNLYENMAINGQKLAINNFDYIKKSIELESFFINNFYAE